MNKKKKVIRTALAGAMATAMTLPMGLVMTACSATTPTPRPGTPTPIPPTTVPEQNPLTLQNINMSVGGGASQNVTESTNLMDFLIAEVIRLLSDPNTKADWANIVQDPQFQNNIWPFLSEFLGSDEGRGVLAEVLAGDAEIALDVLLGMLEADAPISITAVFPEIFAALDEVLVRNMLPRWQADTAAWAAWENAFETFRTETITSNVDAWFNWFNTVMRPMIEANSEWFSGETHALRTDQMLASIYATQAMQDHYADVMEILDGATVVTDELAALLPTVVLPALPTTPNPAGYRPNWMPQNLPTAVNQNAAWWNNIWLPTLNEHSAWFNGEEATFATAQSAQLNVYATHNARWHFRTMVEALGARDSDGDLIVDAAGNFTIGNVTAENHAAIVALGLIRENNSSDMALNNRIKPVWMSGATPSAANRTVTWFNTVWIPMLRNNQSWFRGEVTAPNSIAAHMNIHARSDFQGHYRALVDFLGERTEENPWIVTEENHNALNNTVVNGGQVFVNTITATGAPTVVYRPNNWVLGNSSFPTVANRTIAWWNETWLPYVIANSTWFRGETTLPNSVAPTTGNEIIGVYASQEMQNFYAQYRAWLERGIDGEMPPRVPQINATGDRPHFWSGFSNNQPSIFNTETLRTILAPNQRTINSVEFSIPLSAQDDVNALLAFLENVDLNNPSHYAFPVWGDRAFMINHLSADIANIDEMSSVMALLGSDSTISTILGLLNTITSMRDMIWDMFEDPIALLDLLMPMLDDLLGEVDLDGVMGGIFDILGGFKFELEFDAIQHTPGIRVGTFHLEGFENIDGVEEFMGLLGPMLETLRFMHFEESRYVDHTILEWLSVGETRYVNAGEIIIVSVDPGTNNPVDLVDAIIGFLPMALEPLLVPTIEDIKAELDQDFIDSMTQDELNSFLAAERAAAEAQFEMILDMVIGIIDFKFSYDDGDFKISANIGVTPENFNIGDLLGDLLGGVTLNIPLYLDAQLNLVFGA